jgi:hypothetical protein
LRALELHACEYAAKLAAPRAAIKEGHRSGIAEGDVFAQVRKTLKLRKRHVANN